MTNLLRAHHDSGTVGMRSLLPGRPAQRLLIRPSLNGLVLSDLQAQIDPNPGDRVRLRSRLGIATLEVRLTRPLGLRGSVRADGVIIPCITAFEPIPSVSN